MAETAHRLDTVAADLSSEYRPESGSPEPHRLMRDIDGALVQPVLDVPQRDSGIDPLHFWTIFHI